MRSWERCSAKISRCSSKTALCRLIACFWSGFQATFNSFCCLSPSKKKESFSLSLSCRYEQFVPFEYFMTRGEIPGLNQLSENVLLALLSQAVQWDVGAVSEACQKMLCKYITRENALERLLQAHQKHWTIFKQACIAFINSYAAGFSFYAHIAERLGFEFISFTDKALQTFASFAAVITDLSFPGRLSSDPECIAMMRMVPHLVRLDLSRSHAFAAFEDLPEQLQELAFCLSAHWVEPGIFKQIAHAAPHLCELKSQQQPAFEIQRLGRIAPFYAACQAESVLLRSDRHQRVRHPFKSLSQASRAKSERYCRYRGCSSGCNRKARLPINRFSALSLRTHLCGID